MGRRKCRAWSISRRPSSAGNRNHGLWNKTMTRMHFPAGCRSRHWPSGSRGNSCRSAGRPLPSCSGSRILGRCFPNWAPDLCRAGRPAIRRLHARQSKHWRWRVRRLRSYRNRWERRSADCRARHDSRECSNCSCRCHKAVSRSSKTTKGRGRSLNLGKNGIGEITVEEIDLQPAKNAATAGIVDDRTVARRGCRGNGLRGRNRHVERRLVSARWAADHLQELGPAMGAVVGVRSHIDAIDARRMPRARAPIEGRGSENGRVQEVLQVGVSPRPAAAVCGSRIKHMIADVDDHRNHQHFDMSRSWRRCKRRLPDDHIGVGLPILARLERKAGKRNDCRCMRCGERLFRRPPFQGITIEYPLSGGVWPAFALPPPINRASTARHRKRIKIGTQEPVKFFHKLLQDQFVLRAEIVYTNANRKTIKRPIDTQ